MRSVSDNGATAPISALTYAFSIGSNRGVLVDDSGLKFSAITRRRKTNIDYVRGGISRTHLRIQYWLESRCSRR